MLLLTILFGVVLSFSLLQKPQIIGDIAAVGNETSQFGCVGGVQSYPSHWPNAHYYKRYCSTGRGLAVVTDSLASDAALHQTAYILDSMMDNMADYIPAKMEELGFRQAVMGPYPSETVTDLPEYSHLDPEFWHDSSTATEYFKTRSILVNSTFDTSTSEVCKSSQVILVIREILQF